MTIDTYASIAQVLSFIILLPSFAYTVWRKLDKRLTDQDDRLIRIESQFHRNGGSSLRDSIDRIDRDVAKLTGRFDQHITENNE